MKMTVIFLKAKNPPVSSLAPRRRKRLYEPKRLSIELNQSAKRTKLKLSARFGSFLTVGNRSIGNPQCVI